MQKPGKPDYADPKAYRPIALLNTIGKALEAVITTCISYMVEAYSLLPQTHIGDPATGLAILLFESHMEEGEGG